MHNPIKSGFDYNEAKDMLGLAYAADMLSPYGKGIAYVGTNSEQASYANNPNDPVIDLEGWYPYPEQPIWPKGWTPGLEGESAGAVWGNSILNSQFPPLDDSAQSNFALFTYNKDIDAYCVVFAGTSNIPTVLQDVLYTPVFAGPGRLIPNSDKYGYHSDTTYLNNYQAPPPSKIDEENLLFNQPAVILPTLSLGIRLGLESLTIRPVRGNSIPEMIRKTGRKKMNLYITGHSLGGGMASMFAAWLLAGNIPEIEFDLKVYDYGSEKIGNDVFANLYNSNLTNKGLHFRVINSLDIAPQLPMSEGREHDLLNPKATMTWLPYKTQRLFTLYEHLRGTTRPQEKKIYQNVNFSHVGIPITLPATYPVIFTEDFYPPEFYPNKEEPQAFARPTSNPYDVAFSRIWWQHMPFNYRLYLDKAFGPKKA